MLHLGSVNGAHVNLILISAQTCTLHMSQFIALFQSNLSIKSQAIDAYAILCYNDIVDIQYWLRVNCELVMLAFLLLLLQI